VAEGDLLRAADLINDLDANLEVVAGLKRFVPLIEHQRSLAHIHFAQFVRQAEVVRKNAAAAGGDNRDELAAPGHNKGGVGVAREWFEPQHLACAAVPQWPDKWCLDVRGHRIAPLMLEVRTGHRRRCHGCPVGSALFSRLHR